MGAGAGCWAIKDQSLWLPHLKPPHPNHARVLEGVNSFKSTNPRTRPCPRNHPSFTVQGYLAHKKTFTPLGPP